MFCGIAGGTQTLYHPAKTAKNQGPAQMAQVLDFTAFAVVSKWRDSNPRPFGPERRLLVSKPYLVVRFSEAG